MLLGPAASGDLAGGGSFVTYVDPANVSAFALVRPHAARRAVGRFRFRVRRWSDLLQTALRSSRPARRPARTARPTTQRRRLASPRSRLRSC
jgi:hypothetical protein